MVRLGHPPVPDEAGTPDDGVPTAVIAAATRSLPPTELAASLLSLLRDSMGWLLQCVRDLAAFYVEYCSRKDRRDREIDHWKYGTYLRTYASTVVR